MLLILLSAFSIKAQQSKSVETEKAIPDFASALQFLASPLLEGRETGSQGGYIAAEYIASQFQSMHLQPYLSIHKPQDTRLSDYFQPFELLKVYTNHSSISLQSIKNKGIKIILAEGTDFVTENTNETLLFTSEVVLAGYGIKLPDLGYDNYQGLDVKNKVVLLFDGYPEQQNFPGNTFQKFRTLVLNDEYDLGTKCREAARQGAVAVIVTDPLTFAVDKPKNTFTNEQEDIYTDATYLFPSQKLQSGIPCFRLTTAGSRKLSGISEFEFTSAREVVTPGGVVSALHLTSNIDLKSATDTLKVYNIIGMIPGRDSLKTIVIGAHYDHLGKRGKDIYYGSDDNASGVAGLLALARLWTENHTIPPCNIVFASWTAEEKGLIGSEYYAGQLKHPEQIQLYINMDMISRSVKEDSTGRQLSIGTRIADEYLRNTASSCNSSLSNPFTLDLWDVTGHSGSDYASFTAKNIPVMTYNTGLHDDYHTPRDVSAAADLVKMGDVLWLVNCSIEEVLEFVSNK